MRSTTQNRETEISDEPCDRLRAARLKAGFSSARKAAISHDWKISTYAAHENGQNRFDLQEALKYAEAFDVRPEYLLKIEKRGDFYTPHPLVDSIVNMIPAQPGSAIADQATGTGGFLDHVRPNRERADPETLDNLLQIEMRLDIPVLGVSVGGDDHDFTFNGITVDYVRRPPGIAKARAAYATYVVGESMYPAHREGSLVYVNPDKPPSVGDDVVIELHPKDDASGPGSGYIKRLKKRTSTRLIVEQFNPPEDIEFDLADVKSCHRIVPWNELLGI